jgi:hypothetical protein
MPAKKKKPKKAAKKPAAKKAAARKKAAPKKAAPKPTAGAGTAGPSVTSSPVARFERSAHHALLHAMRGTWRGTTSTWFDPLKTPEDSPTEARVELLLGGRFVRLTYASSVMGTKHAGEMTFGYADEHFTIAWIDSFHTSNAITPLKGEPGRDAISCLGSYAAGTETWGWRIAASLSEEGELLVQEWNISPAGQEDRAIEMRLRRG